MAKKWYVVQAYSGFEKNVQRTLEERIAREEMGDYFGQILVPVEKVVDIRNGRKTISERKSYPGYVLVEMEMTDDSWYLVKSTPRVSGFIGGTANKPMPISQREAEIILQQVQTGAEKPKPKIEFEVGQQIRVNEGPFADFNGVVDEVNYERNKLRVSVQIFGRETPVELQFNVADNFLCHFYRTPRNGYNAEPFPLPKLIFNFIVLILIFQV